jgi:hypothetical protein
MEDRRLPGHVGTADLWTLKRCGVELTVLLQDSLTMPRGVVGIT